MFNIKEYVFDGVPLQGTDMHSFYDGEFIWYPYSDSRTVDKNLKNHIIKFDPANDTLRVIPLADTGLKICNVYQAIQGNDPDTVWLYSAYTTRGLWKFSKSGETSEYIDSDFAGNFGGKITSIILDGVEHIMATIVGNNGYPFAYNTDTGDTTEFDGLGLSSYGIQNDGVNIFMANAIEEASVLKAFTLTYQTDTLPHHVIGTVYDISSIGSLDIAWDGVYVWGSASTSTTTMVEQFEPVYTSEVVTSFKRSPVHYSGSPKEAGPASIKANENYIAAVWESHINDPPTLGWSILDRATGVWSDYWGALTQTVVVEALWPYTEQYWNTVCIEIDAPGVIYITGYGNEGVLVPDVSMRLLKFTPYGTGLYNGALSDGTLSSN